MTALLEIRDLHLSMSSYEGSADVLNGINLTVNRGEIWGLVGESGCGKSLTGLSVSRLAPSPPAHYSKGQILLEGRDLLPLTQREMQKLRGKRIGMIFQDPTTNLNPAFRIGEQLTDVALAAAAQDDTILDCPAHSSNRTRRAAAWSLAVEMLEKVGIPNAQSRLASYPHEFSGGMRQRVLIAMAMIGRPDLLIADEPTTALDVSVQAQILKQIKANVAEYDMGVVLITHNLGVVAQTCSHVAVMYAGNIVENGPVAAVIGNPVHPYTRALLSAIPTKDTKRGALKGLAGAVPNLINPPPGCRFAPRCAFAQPACTKATPPPETVGPNHSAACIRAAEMEALIHA
ncbi:ABC transporter ATP-binding protein [Pseudorhodobacter sp.]|uniref:ABC transporter ATP-binding protein n=1 Tax=Pseudorhodobacter sp. TaxID=1934400 RepID=UPI00264804EE|nr:ABC transporter ATP-binding protein [Pseudorhodobacter sp.]MDN5785836.1 ABC transporter ATP-binding protein [Pseudorhodobacter sp.]